VTIVRCIAAPLAALVLMASGLAMADTAAGKKGKEESSFGAIRAVDPADVRKDAEAWLKSVGKTDATTQAKFKAVWGADRPLLDKVADTLCLGDPEVARLLTSARDEEAPAPTAVPKLLKGSKSSFYRANLALTYGRALTLRKVYEEALETLALAKADDVADPAAYFFHKAVCEHALMLREKADGDIDRLLVDVSESPERYRMVASMMHYDMLTWQEKDLGWISRKMDNIQRRLDLKRGGKQTQRMQKEVLVRLDEMIKELENQQKGSGQGNGGNCPSGGQQPGDGPNSNPNPSAPQHDTKGGVTSGQGEVEKKRVREVAEVWGKLPEKEREKIREELRNKMSAKDRAMLESYIKEMQNRNAKRDRKSVV